MATLPWCPRCYLQYAGTNFCPMCRITDLEEGFLGLARAVRDHYNGGPINEQIAEAMRNAEIVVGPL